MYKDLKTRYWWYGMKRDIAEYVSLCDTCQRVKAEHQRPVGLLQPLKIPEWKWEEIGMDFIVGLPRNQARYDSIWAGRGAVKPGGRARCRIWLVSENYRPSNLSLRYGVKPANARSAKSFSAMVRL
jgi:hypothetical protein